LRRTARQRARYFRSYVQTVLGRDLPEIGLVRVDRSKLKQLLRLLAARTSGLANYSALGGEHTLPMADRSGALALSGLWR
jgi:predicted AAA+ superfamily ATPase